MNPAHLSELSVTGLVLLLFGISWFACASIQPIPVRPLCTGNPTFASSNLPSCSALGPVAIMYYTLGAIASILGGVLLILMVTL